MQKSHLIFTETLGSHINYLYYEENEVQEDDKAWAKSYSY